MAILVTVTASTVLIFRGVSKAWRTGELRTARYQQARLLFDVFERELSSCVSSPAYPLLGIKAAGTTPLHAGPAVSDEIMFTGTLPGRTGFIERGYWVNIDHQLMCHDDESGDADYATGTDELCGGDVAALAITYFDGDEWLDQWELQALGKLPKAVRFVLSVGGQRGEQFETVIHIPTS